MIAARTPSSTAMRSGRAERNHPQQVRKTHDPRTSSPTTQDSSLSFGRVCYGAHRAHRCGTRRLLTSHHPPAPRAHDQTPSKRRPHLAATRAPSTFQQDATVTLVNRDHNTDPAHKSQRGPLHKPQHGPHTRTATPTTTPATTLVNNDSETLSSLTHRRQHRTDPRSVVSSPQRLHWRWWSFSGPLSVSSSPT